MASGQARAVRRRLCRQRVRAQYQVLASGNRWHLCDGPRHHRQHRGKRLDAGHVAGIRRGSGHAVSAEGQPGVAEAAVQVDAGAVTLVHSGVAARHEACGA